MQQLVGYIHGLALAAFLAIHFGGTSLTGWSLWWVLMPEVPLLAIVVKHYGL